MQVSVLAWLSEFLALSLLQMNIREQDRLSFSNLIWTIAQNRIIFLKNQKSLTLFGEIVYDLVVNVVIIVTHRPMRPLAPNQSKLKHQPSNFSNYFFGFAYHFTSDRISSSVIWWRNGFCSVYQFDFKSTYIALLFSSICLLVAWFYNGRPNI